MDTICTVPPTVAHQPRAGCIRLVLTTLFNLSVTTCRIPAIWKSSLIIPIPKSGKDTSQGTSYRPISLICPAAKVLESLFLPTINKYLIPAQDQHGFRREHSTTSTMQQLTTDIAVGFNQRKPPDRTVCVAVDLSAAFDTFCHNNLLSQRDGSPVINMQQLTTDIAGFQRQQPTSGGTVRSSDLQIVVNTSFQTVSSTVFRTPVSLQRLN